MLDRLTDYSSCLDAPDRWAIATVIAVSGSVPRPIGTSMAVRDDALTIGSISGGCVESAIVDAALTCIDVAEPEICDFGFGDDSGLSVGLMCGGDIRVLIEPLIHVASALGSLLDAGSQAVDSGTLIRELPAEAADSTIGERSRLTPLALAEGTYLPADTRLSGEGSADDLDQPTELGLPNDFRTEVGRAASVVEGLIRRGGCGIAEVRDESSPECPIVRRLFVESRRPQARIVIYGANDFSTAIAQAAALLDLRVTVCDARPIFATRDRHPGADEVIVDLPGEHFARECAAGRVDSRTAVIMLTHDPRFDLPVLDQALRMDLAYVGAMGSRTTHERRAQELLHGGLPWEDFAALHSPIGLDIGARTPQEVAVAVLAELIACTHGRTDRTGIAQLRDTSGPVHGERPRPSHARTSRSTGSEAAAGPTSTTAPTTASAATSAHRQGVHSWT